MLRKKSLFTWALALVMAFSAVGFIAASTGKPVSAEDVKQTADNTYLYPLSGYKDAAVEAGPGGIKIFMTTNFGLGKEGIWQGLGVFSLDPGWMPIGGGDENMKAILKDVDEHVLINGKTMSQIREEAGKGEITIGKGGTAFARVVFFYQGEGKIALQFHTDADSTILTYETVKTVTIKQGFQWYSGTGAKLGTTTDKDYTMMLDHDRKQFVRQLRQTEEGKIDPTAVKLLSGPSQTQYFKNDIFNPAGMKFHVVYNDKLSNGNNIEVDVTSEKLFVGEYDFTGSVSGKQKVPVYVNGYEYEIEVDYSAKQVDLTRISQITVEGLKDSYVMEENKVEDLVLKNVPFDDGSSADVELTADNINARLTYEGECTGMINYLNMKNFSFKYKVENRKDIPIELKIDASNYQIFQATVNNRLGVKVSLPGSGTSRKAIENVHMTKWLDKDGKTVSIGDYIFINGVSFTELKSKHQMRKILAYGDTLCFDPYNDKKEVVEDKVPTEFVDKDTGMPIGALTNATIYTIEFKPGFAYVTADKDSWGLGTAMKDSEKYYPVPGGYLKESVLLVRYPATSSLTRWMRPLQTAQTDGKLTTVKQMVDSVLALSASEDGYTKSALDNLFKNVPADAAKISAPGKTTFNVGDEYSAAGLEVVAKYLDGGVETITFNDAAIQGFDSETEGTCECYVVINNTRLTFNVTIQKTPEVPPVDDGGDDDGNTETGCGGGKNAGSAGLMGLLLVAGLAAVKKFF